eukprot:7203043-Alexandrium_andersonii.AAC.1
MDGRVRAKGLLSLCQRGTAQARLACAVVGSGPNGGTGAPSRAKLRPFRPERKNTCSESVDGSVVRTVSESCVVLRAGAECLVV